MWWRKKKATAKWALMTWNASYLHLLCLAMLKERVVRRCMNAAMGWAFEQWRAQIKGLVEQPRVVARVLFHHTSVLQHLLVRMHHMMIAHVIKRWKQDVMEEKEMRHVSHTSSPRDLCWLIECGSKHGILWWCCKQWNALVAHAATRAALLHHWYVRGLKAGRFVEWLEWIADRRRWCVVIGRLVKRADRYLVHALRKHLLHWRCVAALSGRWRCVMANLLVQRHALLQHRAFTAWLDWIQMVCSERESPRAIQRASDTVCQIKSKSKSKPKKAREKARARARDRDAHTHKCVRM